MPKQYQEISGYEGEIVPLGFDISSFLPDGDELLNSGISATIVDKLGQNQENIIVAGPVLNDNLVSIRIKPNRLSSYCEIEMKTNADNVFIIRRPLNWSA